MERDTEKGEDGGTNIERKLNAPGYELLNVLKTENNYY